MVEPEPPCHYRIMDVVLWVIIAAAFAVAEIFTTTLFLMMFAAGALAAAAAAALGAPVSLQAGVFIAVSALTLAAVRPALRRHRRRPGPVDMGTETMLGAAAVVVEQVDANKGMVRIGGELWQARSFADSVTHLPGERVRIAEIGAGTALVRHDDIPDITNSRP